MKPPIIKGDPDKKKSTVAPTSLSTNSGISSANASDKDKAIPYYENPNYLINNKIGRTGYWNEFQKYLQNYNLPTGEKFIQNEQVNKGTSNEFSDKALQDYKSHLTQKFGEGNPNIEKMSITPDDVKQVQTYYNQGNPNFKVDSRIGGETSQLRYPILTKADVKVPEGSYAPVLYGKKQYLSPADKYNSGDITNNLIEYNPSYDAKIDPNALKAIGNYTTQSTNQIQQKANGGKIMPPKKIKGYDDGGRVDPAIDPLRSKQGVIQIGQPQYGSTGNATNAMGKQSSQVNQVGEDKGGMLNSSTISGLTGAATTLGAGLAANQQLKGEQKRKADVGTINSTVDSVASMVPVYGQIYAGAKAASGIGKSMITKDANGNATTAEGAATDALFTPIHEQAIDDISKGNYGDATLDVALGGFYKPIKDYVNFDSNKAKQEQGKQQKLDEFRKINTESKIKQAMANRDSGDFGKQTKDAYDIGSAEFDDAGNFKSIMPTGYKGGGLVGKIKQMCADGGAIKPTITNNQVMEIAMSNKGYDALNKYDKQRVDSMKQHVESKGSRDMITFPKMIQNKADGGKIEGKGTAKSDSIHAKVEEGSFVVPTENAEMAKGIRKLYLRAPVKKANINQKEGEEVKLSNGEHLFTPEENEYLESIGVNLEGLAPNANKDQDDKAYAGGTPKGGVKGNEPFDATKEKNKILNYQNRKGQASRDKYYADKDASQQLESRNKSKQAILDKANEVNKASKSLEYSKQEYNDFIKNSKVGGVLGYTEDNYNAEKIKRLTKIENSQNALKEATKNYKPDLFNQNNPNVTNKVQVSDSDNQPVLPNKTSNKTYNELITPPFGYKGNVNDWKNVVDSKIKSGDVIPKDNIVSTKTTNTQLRAPNINKQAPTPLEMKQAPSLSSVDNNGNVILPSEANLTNNNLKIQDPTTGQQVKPNSKRGKGILSAIGNIDPTMAVGPMQTALGMNMLRGSTRPVDNIVLNGTYNSNVDRAQAQAGYGYSPEQTAMLNQDNQNSLTDARFSARNFAGGNSGTAFNQERQAINQGWANKLGLTSADQQLRMQKQQYADEQVSNRAQTLSANRRQMYLDALGAFQQKQQAGSELIGAGLQNAIGSYRYNKELNNENQADAQRNDWTSKIGKTNI